MSKWFNMAAGGILATALGIMGIRIFADALYGGNNEAVGYPVAVAESGGEGGAAAGPELLPDWGTLFADPAKLADYQSKGEKVSKVCLSCHDFSPAGANKTGPGLAGVLGRAAASHGGFAYSDAMKAYGQSWSYDNLDAFLHNPKKAVKGTAMSFAGLPKAEDRIALIAYLRSISPSAPAIPAPDPTRDPAQAAAAAAAPADAAANATNATNAAEGAVNAATNATNAVANATNAVANAVNAAAPVAAPK